MAGFIASSGRFKSAHVNISYEENTEITRLILGSNAVTAVVAVGIATTFPVTVYHVLHLLVTHWLVVKRAAAILKSSFQQEE